MIAGSSHGSQVGAQLYQAAERIGITCCFVNTDEAYRGWVVARKIAWSLGRRPLRLDQISQNICKAVFQSGIQNLLTTGLAPIHANSLKQMKKMGTRLANFSTDDPWNPAHRAGWFLSALPEYDRVFSTRKANLHDFAALGVKASHLPFGYEPDLYFWDRGEGIGDRGNEEAKVFLAGGGDADRYPLIQGLQEAGIEISLWGEYWNQAGLKSGGFLDAAGIRKQAAECMVSLVLVRRANRDGSAMRSFEIPACGACCVAEDTEEHRELFGPDGEAVLYFKTPEQLVRRVKEAFGNPELRAKLRANAHRAITGKPNTYVDRLKTILERVEEQKRIGDRE